MPEDDQKSGFPKWLFPIGSAVILLLSNLPPLPTVLFEDSQAWFKGIGAAGLLFGIGFGAYLTNKEGKLRSKRVGLRLLAVLAVIFLVVHLRYHSVLKDAENHYYETVIEFFLANIVDGTLLFLVIPGVKAVATALSGKADDSKSDSKGSSAE